MSRKAAMIRRGKDENKEANGSVEKQRGEFNRYKAGSLPHLLGFFRMRCLGPRVTPSEHRGAVGGTDMT